MLIRPQVKHIRQLVKLCDNYHAMSRFKDESPIEEDNLHDFFKAIITRPTVFLNDCCRGKGWAEKMLENAKTWAKANNSFEIITSDYAVDPDRTGKWLESIGFEKVGVTYGIKV